MFRPIQPIAAVNGFPIQAGWYGAFETASAEQAREALLEQFRAVVTPCSGTECPRCQGRGYTRQDGRVGCEVCHGRGVTNG